MELNDLTYFLKYNGVETAIEEPKGFDGLSFTMERGDYHGMSAEFSQENLGFYHAAAPIVEAAYQADIDSKVELIVRDGNTEVYSGVLDLSTYSKQTAPYTIINCRIGNIGTQTMLNNRSDTDVDLNTTTTVDGDALAHVPTWKSLLIPQKHLKYTNRVEQIYARSSSDYVTSDKSSGHFYGKVLFDKDSVNEYGTLDLTGDFSVGGFLINPLYKPSEDHVEKYGTGTKQKIEGEIKLYVSITGGNPLTNLKYRIKLYSVKNGRETVELQSEEYNDNITREITWNFSKDNIDAEADIHIALHATFTPTSETTSTNFHMDSLGGSYAKFTMYDNRPNDTYYTPCLPVHEALNTIVEAIARNGATVRSDYYSHQQSVVNPKVSGIDSGYPNGHGALKVLTNGYKMRGLFTDPQTGSVRNMPLSFKSIIESLNALDCIGWGFSREDASGQPSASGALYVRVEDRQWFYKMLPIESSGSAIAINDANEVTLSLDAQKIPTELTIGYKKYKTNEDYNSIDSVHGERTFTSGIVAVSNKEEHLCDFIADNYSIEEARRARQNIDPLEEGDYDESIFVFECVDNRQSASGSEQWEIQPSFVSGSLYGVERPAEFINCKLTPRRCAERWADWLSPLAKKNNMKFTSGKLNYYAGFADIVNDGFTLEAWHHGSSATHPENLNITHPNTGDRNFISAETLEFEYPIQREWYEAIKANPYGYITVNGRKGWIKKMEYQFVNGLAKFTLIMEK